MDVVDGFWQDFLGTPSKNFNSIWYGDDGSGKSSAATQLAYYLQRFGRVNYYSAEEGISKTLQDRLAKLGIMTTTRLVFYPIKDKDEMVDNITRTRPTFIFIDSADEMDLTDKWVQELKTKFKGRKSIYTIHKSPKNPPGKWGYNCDIRVQVVAGTGITKKNRFRSLARHIFFKPTGGQPTLFDQGK